MKTEWILCPVCGNKTRTMIQENTEMRNFPLYCPKCKNFKVLETDEPCNECLTECAREGSKKPVKFEEARVKVK